MSLTPFRVLPFSVCATTAMLLVGLGSRYFGLGGWMANDDNGLLRLEPEFAVGQIETPRNQLDQAINQIDLGNGFPRIRWMLAGAEAVIDKIACPDFASGYGYSSRHPSRAPEHDVQVIMR
jgi:hypothetical protein